MRETEFEKGGHTPAELTGKRVLHGGTIDELQQSCNLEATALFENTISLLNVDRHPQCNAMQCNARIMHTNAMGQHHLGESTIVPSRKSILPIVFITFSLYVDT